MGLQIVSPLERIDVPHPVFVIVGQPGSGKSTLGYSMAEPLLVDADEGAARAKNRKFTLPVRTWADLESLVDPRHAADLVPFKSVVADTVGRVLNHLETDIAVRDPKNARRGGSLSQQGYGLLKQDFAAWFRRVRALDKDVLLLAHDKESGDGDDKIVRADMTGSSYAEVMKVADFVGFLRVDGKQRILDFSPGRWVGKNPAGWDPFVVPHYHELGAFMAELYDRGRQALGQISADGAALAERVGAWKAALASITTIEGVTRAFTGAQAMLAGAPKAERIACFDALQQRAKDIGCRWNAEQRAFEVAPDAKPQPATHTQPPATVASTSPFTAASAEMARQAAAAQTQPDQQEPALTTDADPPPSPLAVRVVEVEEHAGVTNGKPWRRWAVTLSTGTQCSTFSSSVAGQAAAAKISREWMDVSLDRRGDYLTLAAIGPAHPALPMDAATPTPAHAADSDAQVAPSLASTAAAALDPDAPDAEKEPLTGDEIFCGASRSLPPGTNEPAEGRVYKGEPRPCEDVAPKGRSRKRAPVEA